MAPRWIAIFAVLVVGGTSMPARTEEAPDDRFGRKYPARQYYSSRLAGQGPAIDGRLDDPAWTEGEWAGDFRQQLPTEGAPPSRATALKILYDDHHLYVAIRAFDDPALVHRYPGRRDVFVGDMVGICVDSHNGKQHGYEFDLTAGGSKVDLILGNGENDIDTTWDAVWDGAVAHDTEGWTAEFRIPLDQLRYGRQDQQVWGLHAWRWIDRHQEESQWQLIPRQNTGRMYQLGELRGIRGLPPSRHLELVPYATGRVRGGAGSPNGSDGSAAVGVDVKLGLSSSFTVDATVNPDFGQVEADPSLLNLTAFETFYEEKRPFFLEGRSILAFSLDDEDQVFYSRRIGQAPSFSPAVEEGQTLRAPENTTILSAVKVTGKTGGGLSVGFLQSLTQTERATLSSPRGDSRPAVEPFGSYTVGRLHKDWNKGNTSLGVIFTQTHRFISEPALEFLPKNALTGGVDFKTHLADRSYFLTARLVGSHVTGAPAAVDALRTSAVHYFQRPDATHLDSAPGATSLSGHGGWLGAGRTEKGRFRLSDTLHWYSPGLDLNEAGYLRAADIVSNRAVAGWSETSPQGPFRTYFFEVARTDAWDFGGLKTRAETEASAYAQLRNKWDVEVELARGQETDTRALRGGPALTRSAIRAAELEIGTDGSRRLSAGAEVRREDAEAGPSAAWRVAASLATRPSRRLSVSADLARGWTTDDLQYVTTARTSDGARYLLGRLDLDTWELTLRADLALTPDLSVQYYASPFVAAGRYDGFHHVTDGTAAAYEARFHRYDSDEISAAPADGAYVVTERTGIRYTFSDPDFSFRQLRSNLVARWEYRPGSSLFLVWSHGRTAEAAEAESALGRNWSALWNAPRDDVFAVKVRYWFSP